MESQTLFYEETTKLPEVFTKENIQLILDTIDASNNYLKNDWGIFMKARDKCIVMTIYLLGLRPLEACALRFDDFNLNDMTIHIRGENNKVKKDRILPMPISLAAYLKEYLAFSRERFWKGSVFLFPSLENPHISSQRWKAIFREILKEANLWLPPVNSTVPPYRSYTLRHTRASEILDQTKDLFLVANILGHAKLSSTKVYLHKSKGYMEYMRKELNTNLTSL